MIIMVKANGFVLPQYDTKNITARATVQMVS